MKTITYFILIGLYTSMFGQTMGKQSVAQLEESPAGSKILWFMDVVKGGEAISDEVIKTKFAPKLIEKMGLDELKNMITDLQQKEGVLLVYKAKREKVTQYKLKVKGKKSNQWFEMQFYFEESRPYRLLGFTIDSVDGMEEGEPIYPTLN
ncbi:hypothetical protein [Ekhidna sp.]|uniref:hypothetical protein n=1 Tax=Ekhidna sp. TaxID=2608089 RepID=UPI00329A0639